jgi:uncharacterized protein YgiB involved in biofilm formation
MMPRRRKKKAHRMSSRRSAATLTLVLIGTSALPGCGGGEGDQKAAARDVYRTRADCQRDWGDDPKKCEQQSSGRHSGYFYGPMYHGSGFSRSTGTGADSATMAPRKGSSAIGTTSMSSGGSVSRGGFGSSASAHSSGG